jgi:hypothetical protein
MEVDPHVIAIGGLAAGLVGAVLLGIASNVQMKGAGG